MVLEGLEDELMHQLGDENVLPLRNIRIMTILFRIHLQLELVFLLLLVLFNDPLNF